MTQVGGVVERMPMAYLDRGDANGHGVLFRGCVFLSAVRAILRVFTSALKGEPDIAGALGSVGRAAFDPERS
jgi:hypothetical protein